VSISMKKIAFILGTNMNLVTMQKKKLILQNSVLVENFVLLL